MRLKEQRLWDTFKEHKPKGVHMQRIENAVGAGIPDVLVTNRHTPRGVCSWVELKAVNRPARKTTRFLGTEGVRLSQRLWHKKAQRHNQRSYILIRDDHGELFLVDGLHAFVINDWPLAKVRHHTLANNWPDIFEEIIAL